jgi:hypothetical protein
MGADGHIHIVSRAAWDENCPGVQPGDIGLYTGTVLGIDAAWGYAGDNMYDWTNYGVDHTDDARYVKDDDGEWKRVPLTDEEKAAIRAAADWFDANHESHEVWT